MYAGTKIASSMVHPAGKAAVIAGTVITSRMINSMFDNKNPGLKINTQVNSDNEDEPPSPSESGFSAFSTSEPGDMGSSIYYTIETTDTYFKFLEAMLNLSELSLVFMFAIGVNLILILIDFEKFEFFKSRPNLLKWINRTKLSRKGLVLAFFILTVVCLIAINFGLHHLISELLRVKKFIK